MRSLRNVRLWGMQHGFGLVLAFLVVGFGLSLVKPKTALADPSVADLKALALSDVALNLRLAALDKIKQAGSTGAADALEAIAKDSSVPLGCAACAQLGRMKTTTSKGKLRALLEDTTESTQVREAAAAAIACHWKDSGDISYLQSKCSGNDDLVAFFDYLKKSVYKVQ